MTRPSRANEKEYIGADVKVGATISRNLPTEHDPLKLEGATMAKGALSLPRGRYLSGRHQSRSRTSRSVGTTGGEKYEVSMWELLVLNWREERSCSGVWEGL